MAIRYTVAMFLAVGAALALLGLRQKRIQTMHDMAVLHAQMDRTRQDLWRLQMKIADGMSPPVLQAAAKRVHLQLEPVTPLPVISKAKTDQVDAQSDPDNLPPLSLTPANPAAPDAQPAAVGPLGSDPEEPAPLFAAAVDAAQADELARAAAVSAAPAGSAESLARSTADDASDSDKRSMGSLSVSSEGTTDTATGLTSSAAVASEPVAQAGAASAAPACPPGDSAGQATYPCPPDPRDPTAEGAVRVLSVGKWVLAAVSIGLVALLIRIGQLQVHPPARIERLVNSQMSRAPLQPRRGTFVDRQDRPLAGSQEGAKLFIDPRLIPDQGSFPERIAADFGYDPAKVARLIFTHSERRFAILDPMVSQDRLAKIRAQKIVGLGLLPLPLRDYPDGRLAGQLIGAVSKDNRGLDGLEKALDKYLQGVPGRITYWRDARRQPIWIDQDQYKPPVDGRNVRLTLDAEIQAIAEEELAAARKQYGAPMGEMIVMQPETGQVLAMANYPPYDPNHFNTTAPALARNRCVTDSFEPGSIFKPFVWSYITQLEMMRPNQIVPTGAGLWVAPGGRRLHDASNHGSITWDQVLVLSSNIGMAMGAQHMRPQQLYDDLHAFGFGSRTGSGLPGEVAGQLHPLKKWSLFSMSSLPMGQEIAVTPLQITRAFCAIANGGMLIRPIMLMSDAPPDGQMPALYRVLSPEVAAHTRAVLRRVVTEGTGRKANSPLYTIFGKTGTAQVADHVHGGYQDGKYTAAFIGSAPLDHPQLVVCCVIHTPDKAKGHYGGTVSAPAVKNVIERTLAYLGVPPDRAQSDENLPQQNSPHRLALRE